MATKWLLDASAVLAWLQEERGSEVVDEVLDSSVMCSLNVNEVLHKLIEKGATVESANEIVNRMAVPVVDFTADHSRAATKYSKFRGLSLGDRGCLAVADAMGIIAVTADQAWSKTDGPVRIIREATQRA